MSARYKRSVRRYLLLSCVIIIGCGVLLSSCSVTHKVSKQATQLLLQDTAIRTGHIGISIFEPATGKYWYNYNATRYFVPASNTKLFSLYAGLKYLGDSLPGMRYQLAPDGTLQVAPTGDPTFLHPDYVDQPVYDFLKKFSAISFTNSTFTDDFQGRGWAWDDYLASYMTQRSNLPIYGNLVQLSLTGGGLTISPAAHPYYIPANISLTNGFDVDKKWDDNLLTIKAGTHQRMELPFTPEAGYIASLLQDTLGIPVALLPASTMRLQHLLPSRPTDSMFIPMMHRSDNFFAEQTLLMASNEIFGYMNDRKLIDSLLSTDLKNVPQLPKWVDGSGLSRYNLFTPQSFIFVLNKMKEEFGLERLKRILPTGGKGTIASYYQQHAGSIFAKTGTLSNHCALSGFLVTKNNKLLIFSVLANNYQTSATPVRRAVEKFLVGIRERY